MFNLIYWVKHPRVFFDRVKGMTATSNVFLYDVLSSIGIKCPDKIAVQALYFKAKGKKLNLKHPVTFNDKLNWLKLNQRDRRLTNLVDKVKVKDIVGSIIGHRHIIKTLGVWQKFEDIDFETLPEQFVLKTNHDSGTVVVCRSKATFDFERARHKLEKAMANDYYIWGREWPYKNVERRILAEEFLEYSEPLTVDTERWSQVSFKAPRLGEQFAEIYERGLTEAIGLARSICSLYELSNSSFYKDRNGYLFGVITINTPPNYKSIDLKGFLNDLPENYTARNIDDNSVEFNNGKNSIVLRHKRNYEELNDYKLFCFNGRVKMLKVDFDRSFAHKANYYSRDWQYIPVCEDVVPTDSSRAYERPHRLDDIIRMAEQIVSESLDGEILPFVRVDFYVINDKVYFGEFTLYPGGGTDDFIPDEMNYTIGSWIELPR